MNTHNEWKNLLGIYNKELDEKGYAISIVENEDGYYDCEILKGGKCVEVYAENYFEEELDELITDAYYHVREMKK